MAGKTTRVQLQLSEPAIERLKKLQELTDSPNYVDVFKNSLRVYEWLIRETLNGSQFQVKDADGNVTAAKIFLDNSTPTKD